MNRLENYKALLQYGEYKPEDEKQIASTLKNAGTKGINILIEALKVGNSDEFCKRVLVEIGEPAVPALVKALQLNHGNTQRPGIRKNTYMASEVYYCLKE